MLLHPRSYLSPERNTSETTDFRKRISQEIFAQAEIPWEIFIHVFFSCFLFLHLLYYSYYFPENSFPKF